MSTLQLSSEICKASMGQIVKRVENIYSFSTLLRTISNPKTHPKIRATFIDILQYSYFSYDSRHIMKSPSTTYI